MSILESAQNRVLIAAHRGAAGGNIPCNSMPAFKAALAQGADIIELDISRSSDGALYVYHPGTEPIFLLSDTLISDMTHDQVEKLRLVNQDNTPTEWGVERLETVLSFLRGKCFINLDKFWTCPEEIAAIVRRLGMQDQVLIKTSNTQADFKRVEETAWDIPYIVIARNHDDFSSELLRRNIRYIGVEALFDSEGAPIAQPSYTESMSKKQLITWANGIVYDYKAILSAGHNDDVSVCENPDLGWGWLVDRGFRIIQTDWTLALDNYLHKRNLR